MPAIERSFPEDMAIEAVLHVFDGSPLTHVARKYGVSNGALSLIVHGHRRIHIRSMATKIYYGYRDRQLERGRTA